MNKKLKDFFEKKYLETPEECLKILNQSEIASPYTKEDYIEACFELCKFSTEKQSFKSCVEMISKMSYYGIIASVSGIALREVVKVINET